ncbi:hypothetical protein F5148DRAFT_1290303 [Russula earlei]|uniref:Uncharacterized protein n=1 Tax=Russula earlei TaxID=71964 RepID=A0ACC0TW62_9AGAM|nr:hypothetical protein F5148DRAFT_1290303 [Russula earlei]
MKNSLKIGVVTLSLLAGITFTANAQTSNNSNSNRPGNIVLSAGPESGLPVSNLKDVYDWSIGGSIQGDFAIIKKSLYVTVNGAFNNFFASKDIDGAKDLRLVPVKAGLKFYAWKNLYVQGLAGVSFIANKDDIGADKSAVFAYSPQIGYLIPLGKGNFIDAGVKFESNTKFVESGSSESYLGVRVAYAFNL